MPFNSRVSCFKPYYSFAWSLRLSLPNCQSTAAMKPAPISGFCVWPFALCDFTHVQAFLLFFFQKWNTNLLIIIYKLWLALPDGSNNGLFFYVQCKDTFLGLPYYIPCWSHHYYVLGSNPYSVRPTELPFLYRLSVCATLQYNWDEVPYYRAPSQFPLMAMDRAPFWLLTKICVPYTAPLL